MPIRAERNTKGHAFNMGQASALVEIISATVGAWLVTQNNGYSEVATMAFMLGFAIMMTLDVALG